MENKEISQAVVSRLPRYFRYLGELKDEGIERISSQELSDIMHVTASQIRQDFNNFGDRTHNLIIIGAGNLGQALANYMNFERRGFLFRGMFDNNPALYGKEIKDMKIMPMEEMESFVKENQIDIAVLTIPKNSAVAVAERLVSCGIRGIWNFAHVDLNVPKGIQVENVHLSDSLMKGVGVHGENNFKKRRGL